MLLTRYWGTLSGLIGGDLVGPETYQPSQTTGSAAMPSPVPTSSPPRAPVACPGRGDGQAPSMYRENQGTPGNGFGRYGRTGAYLIPHAPSQTAGNATVPRPVPTSSPPGAPVACPGRGDGQAPSMYRDNQGTPGNGFRRYWRTGAYLIDVQSAKPRRPPEDDAPADPAPLFSTTSGCCGRGNPTGAPAVRPA